MVAHYVRALSPVPIPPARPLIFPRLLPLILAGVSLACPGRIASATELPADVYPGLRGADGKLLPAVAGYLGRDLRVVEVPLDAAMVARRGGFGYSDAEIERWFSAPRRMVLDDTGLDARLLKPPPAPDVHPRVLFNPEDLPDIRRRLAETESGRRIMRAIRDHLDRTLTGPAAKFRADYEALVAGTPPAKLENTVAYSLMYEAFRCLVDADEAGGARVAAAITTFAGLVDRDLAAARARARPGPLDLSDPGAEPPLFDARVVAGEATREYTLGLDYDFAHGFMTPAQRDAVRGVLARATAGMTTLGAEALPALHPGASYWIPWTCRLLFAVTAIEGEPGYDPATYARFADAQIAFLNTLNPTGESFEGWGKNFLSLEHFVILAKRGRNVVGHTRLRAVFNDYFVAAATPWGRGFTFYDSLAKSGGALSRPADLVIYQALFPKDAAGGFALRNQVSGDPENLGSRLVNTRHFLSVYDALSAAIFARDPALTAPEEFAAVTSGRPLTYFGPDSGNLITRSAWDPGALYFGYQNRSVPGSHPLCDRSHFNLYSHGRFWGIYQYARDIKEQSGPIMRSVVMTGDLGPSTAEARSVAFADTPLATFTASDLANPWNFQTASFAPAPAGAELGAKTRSYNHFRLTPSPLPWMDLPIGGLPDWYTSQKPGSPSAGAGATGRRDWYRRFDAKHAFRTAGLVRGPHPYALILDDLQLDATARPYVWGMTLPPDVRLVSARRLGDNAAEILLEETATPAPPALLSAKPRRLLVRVLSAAGLADPPAELAVVKVKNTGQPDLALNRLQIRATAVDPAFRVLLFPHETGDPLPEVAGPDEAGSVTIRWPDQSDALRFPKTPDGRSRVVLKRGDAFFEIP